MRYILILTIIIFAQSLHAKTETALDRFVLSGGEIIKEFKVDGLNLTGLVLKSPLMPSEVIAYTDHTRDFIFVGALIEKITDTNKLGESPFKTPMIIDGLQSPTYKHYENFTKAGSQIVEKKEEAKASASKENAINNGKKASEKSYQFLGDLAYISEGDTDSPLVMYILYDVACGYCRKLFDESRGLLGKYHFKWVPIVSVGDPKDTARDLVANKLYSKPSRYKAEKRHINTVINNTRIIKETGFIELATPTAIIYDTKDSRYKVASGITGRQLTAFYEYVYK